MKYSKCYNRREWQNQTIRMYKVGIFIPIYFNEEATKKCLLSLLRTNLNQLSVFLCLGVNGASQSLQKFISEYVKEHSGKEFRQTINGQLYGQ